MYHSDTFCFLHYVVRLHPSTLWSKWERKTQLLSCFLPHSGISGNYSIVKGCASPSWCNSPYTSIYKNLGSVKTHCCTGDLCNSLIIDGQLKPSPRSQANQLTLAHHTITSTGLLLFIVFLLSWESSWPPRGRRMLTPDLDQVGLRTRTFSTSPQYLMQLGINREFLLRAPPYAGLYTSHH